MSFGLEVKMSARGVGNEGLRRQPGMNSLCGEMSDERKVRFESSD